jgi:hypothetical protein
MTCENWAELSTDSVEKDAEKAVERTREYSKKWTLCVLNRSLCRILKTLKKKNLFQPWEKCPV